jgi:hypothetical protein
MMKQLTVYFQDDVSGNDPIYHLASRLRSIEKHPLLFAPWAHYPYKPAAQFSLSYGPDAFFLQFDVKEKFIKGSYGKINEPVYLDSCVEFFVSFDDNVSYYNFEFNCIGTVLAGFGKGKKDRQWLPQETLEKIKSAVLISRGGNEKRVQWEISLAIPFDVFLHHSLTSLQGKRYRANFYKCGDELPEPHFLCWSNIESKEPDFHLPEFFGTVDFQ